MIKLARLAAASAFVVLPLTGNASADCTCWARGVVAGHGQTICLRTPQGQRLARCDKVLNVASWTFLPGPCPLADRTPLAPGKREARQNVAGEPYWLALSD
jgi:hypothetical protein